MNDERHLSKETRVCPECGGRRQIMVDVALERFRRRMGRIALIVCALASGAWCSARLWNGHVEIVGWIITFGAVFYAIAGDANERT